MRDAVRVGGGSGFWGDTPEGAAQLVRQGGIQYLVLDYLAEITMALMARARERRPELGYAPDLVTQVIGPLGKEIAARGIKIIANAGGVNPAGCRDALLREIAAQGLPLRVAAVLGDDVLPLLGNLPALAMDGTAPGAHPPFATANAYLGAFPIAAALAAGADIVVTGRCADSAMTLGALIHEFGWGPDDCDRLAAGSMAGHLIECGPQVTGGILTDWDTVAESWATIGFPVAECRADGVFAITKPAGTGGAVTVAGVAEQLGYEVGDPANYVLPDVVCDLREVRLEQLGPDRVAVSGLRGRPRTDSYKVSATYPDGHRATATLLITGRDAGRKARAAGEALLARTRHLIGAAGLGDYRETSIEALGAEEGYGPHARPGAREVVLKVAVHHDSARAVETFAREVHAATTAMAPGTAGGPTGRPKAVPMTRLVSLLVPKSGLSPSFEMDGVRYPVAVRQDGQATPSPTPPGEPAAPTAEGPTVAVPLAALAHARSGDKGDLSNIVLLARQPEWLPMIAAGVTAEAVADYLRHAVRGRVERYPWPGLCGFNFLLHEALGGGGVSSLRYDAQGKGLAQVLLDMPVQVPAAWLDDGLLSPVQAI
ncbi:acyclic terpene utilization AtuA family protein [Roseomonas xinghualingensis]|uniref:acyclic terpene utilization AtuA family protein n=1 Tax=Roseomonas xinghualingensis TaxID=2986475 RepID=UPI0021F1E742|nr:acyclic terpene utilization AtuA family protein [Roseomonas sp. SXEYE001]MCV4210308.1 DUF1446 domain-containing protein [Roseomonas sp. SXEYE001]